MSDELKRYRIDMESRKAGTIAKAIEDPEGDLVYHRDAIARLESQARELAELRGKLEQEKTYNDNHVRLNHKLQSRLDAYEKQVLPEEVQEIINVLDGAHDLKATEVARLGINPDGMSSFHSRAAALLRKYHEGIETIRDASHLGDGSMAIAKDNPVRFYSCQQYAQELLK